MKKHYTSVLLFFSHSFVSDSLWSHGLQHTRFPCPSFTISQSLLKFIFIELMMLSNHFILYHPLLLPSIFPSIMVFSNESTLPMRWPKYWSLGISPSSEYSRLISFRISWFDLLDVQWTLKSTPASQVQRHRFFVTLPFLLSSSHIHTWLLEKP